LQKHPEDHFENISEWGGDTRFNIALLGIDNKESGHTFVDRALILHINPDANKFGIFSVNTNFVSKLPDDTNQTIKLSYMQGIDEGEQVLYTLSSLEYLLGIQIDRYIFIDNEKVLQLFDKLSLPDAEIESNIRDPDFPTIKQGKYGLSASELYYFLATDSQGEDAKMQRLVDYLQDYFESYDNILNILNIRRTATVISQNIYTNISKMEFLRMFLFLRQLRTDQIKIAFTRESAAKVSNDEFQTWSPIIQNIDRDLSSIFINANVKLEQAKIEVMNGTSTQGLAYQKARLIENSGCRIVRTGNAAQLVDKNLLYVTNPDSYEQTIKEIKAVFNNNIEIRREEYPYRHIGDLVVVIGEG
jgi:anionic cell wall polymer biosynthesis LytR-Cps2A-Psr (LCP) family protein